MSLPTDPIPAPGFIAWPEGKKPRNQTAQFEVQYRNGYIDKANRYTAMQIRWQRWPDGKPCDWDIVAVRKVG